MKFCIDMASETSPAYWLVLLGTSGVGKTHLARSCVQFFNRNLDMLVDETRSGDGKRYLRHGGTKSWVNVMSDCLSGDYGGISILRDDWLIALDDISAEYSRNKELSVAKLYEVLNSREGKWTIVTANLSLEEISSQLDRRIASRLVRNNAVVVDVADKIKDWNLR